MPFTYLDHCCVKPTIGARRIWAAAGWGLVCSRLFTIAWPRSIYVLLALVVVGGGVGSTNHVAAAFSAATTKTTTATDDARGCKSKFCPIL